MSKRNDVYHRAFLNTTQGTAAVEVTVEGGEYATLTLSDCNRQITLSFDFSTATKKRGAKKKLNRLTYAIAKINEALHAD